MNSKLFVTFIQQNFLITPLTHRTAFFVSEYRMQAYWQHLGFSSTYFSSRFVYTFIAYSKESNWTLLAPRQAKCRVKDKAPNLGPKT